MQYDYDEDEDYPRMSSCAECDKPFMCKGAWHTLCWSCFSQTPEGKAWQRKKDAERAGRFREEAYGAGRQDYSQGQKPDPDNMDLGMCRLLIQLCHPDKHAGSQGATKATQWLNERMKKLRV